VPDDYLAYIHHADDFEKTAFEVLTSLHQNACLLCFRLSAVLSITRTSTRSCRTRKRAFHFCSPGVVRRIHAAALHMRSAAAAADAHVYSQFAD